MLSRSPLARPSSSTPPLSLAALVLATLGLAACVSTPAEPPQTPEAAPQHKGRRGSMRGENAPVGDERYARMTVDQLATKLAAKERLWVYDVGDPSRFNGAHIPAARWVDALELSAADLPPDPNEPIVFYCDESRPRAALSAANTALSLGHLHVSVLPDGITGWQRAGREVARGPASK